MSLAGAIVLSALAILLLSTLRSRLLYEFVGLSLLLFKSTLFGKWVYTLIFLPGTILHELSHWLVAELLRVRTGEITVLPEFDDGTFGGARDRLGSVQTAQAGPIRSFLIGLAPFITGLAVLYVLGHLLMQGDWMFWQYALIFYGVVVVGSSMLLSAEDRRSWPFMLIFVVVISTFYFLLPYRLPATWLDSVTRLIIRLNQILFVTAGAILAIIGISYTLRRIIERILGKKITRR